MEKGLILVLLSALAFAGSGVAFRRGTVRAGESFTAVLITAFVGTILFLLILPFSGGWEKLWSLSWQGFALLGSAGIIHFAAGRLLFYNAIRLIGANKATPLLQTSPFYAVALGIFFLHEPLSAFLIPGVVLIAAGATLVSFEKEEKTIKVRGRGILYGLGAAVCWGISGVLIKSAIGEIGSSSTAALIAYITALPIIASLLLRQEQRKQLSQLRRATLIPLVIGGILTFLGQLLWYEALMYSPVSVATPLLSTNVIFILLLSFLLNRNIEVFTWKVIAGVVITVAGTYLLFQ